MSKKERFINVLSNALKEFIIDEENDSSVLARAVVTRSYNLQEFLNQEFIYVDSIERSHEIEKLKEDIQKLRIENTELIESKKSGYSRIKDVFEEKIKVILCSRQVKSEDKRTENRLRRELAQDEKKMRDCSVECLLNEFGDIE